MKSVHRRMGALLLAPVGTGFGLPIARLYSRYFGGDLKLYSMDGYGTDAFLYLPKVGNECVLRNIGQFTPPSFSML